MGVAYLLLPAVVLALPSIAVTVGKVVIARQALRDASPAERILILKALATLWASPLKIGQRADDIAHAVRRSLRDG